jgi:hypothetical protein
MYLPLYDTYLYSYRDTKVSYLAVLVSGPVLADTL